MKSYILRLDNEYFYEEDPLLRFITPYRKKKSTPSFIIVIKNFHFMEDF